ncbi:MAG TPA: mucoidy inhibitor MuiA family protein [Hyphomicrobiaceae bacterium]|nr:mucoidy inhibitor MuiA family protein [Hyphomicrobiaceae bacterium]
MFACNRSHLVFGASALALSAVLGDAVSAAEVKAASKIEAVTVYTQGADIVRSLKTNVPAGDHVIVINDLPAGANPQSIRIEAKTTGGTMQIGSVDTRRVSVPREDAAQIASQRKALEDEIERLKDQKAVLQADIQAAEQQKALITSMTQIPTRPVANGGAPEPDWMKLAQFIGERSAAIQKSILETGIKIRDQDRRIEDVAKKLRELAPAPVERTEVKVHVAASAALTSDIVVRYQVGAAGWLPFYDARLATGAKGQPAKLQLIRRASITQRTGEAWDDVALTLSTTRPSAATAAPELNMLSVDFRVDRPVAKSVPYPASAPPPMVAGAMRERAEMDMSARKSGLEDKPEPTVAPEASAGVDLTGLQAVFNIPGKVSVAPTGEQKRVQIMSEDLDANLVVRTVPRLDQTAYLYAKTTLPKTSALLLPGAVSLFRDGTFVGQGRVPQLAQGEEHELGFGADDLVKVKRVVLEDKKGESGIFTSTRAEDRNFVITVKNLRANPVPVVVVDRIPVAAHTDIKVEPTFRPQPTKRDVNDRRGTVQWEFTANPDVETQIAFGYRVSAPAGRPLDYVEKTPEEINVGAQRRF